MLKAQSTRSQSNEHKLEDYPLPTSTPTNTDPEIFCSTVMRIPIEKNKKQESKAVV